MTTFYDHRAERTVAEAEADTRRAQAEAMRAQTASQVERDHRQLLREERQEQRKEKEEKRQQKAAKKAAASLKWQNRRRSAMESASVLATAARARSHSIVAAAAMGSPMFIAWGGQFAFAEEVMHLDAAVTLPIAMEGAVLFTGYLTHRAIDKGLPSGRYRLMTWLMAGNAAGMNLWHQVDKLATQSDPWAGLQVGAIYGVSSLLGIVLWELNAGLKRQVSSKRTGAEIRQAAWRRARYPRLSWSAASIRAAKACTVEEAWTAAWTDRYGLGPDSSRRDRKLARKIVRYRADVDRKAAKSGRLSIANGTIVGRPPAEIDQPTPEGDKALETLRGFDSGSVIRRALSRASRAVQTSLNDTSSDTDREVASQVSLPVAPRVSLVPPLPARPALPEPTSDTTPDTPGDTGADTRRVVSLPVAAEVSEDIPDAEVDAFIAALRDTETDTGSDTETATASATEEMRRYWDTAIADGRVPSGTELADAVGCAKSYGRRMRRLWLDEMDGRTRRYLLNTKKVTA